MVDLVTSALQSAVIRQSGASSATKNAKPSVLEVGANLIERSTQEAENAGLSLNQPFFTSNESFLAVASAGTDNNVLSQFLSSQNTNKTEVGDATQALIAAASSQETEIENLTQAAIEPVLNNELTNILEIESAEPSNNDELFIV